MGSLSRRGLFRLAAALALAPAASRLPVPEPVPEPEPALAAESRYEWGYYAEPMVFHHHGAGYDTFYSGRPLLTLLKERRRGL